MRKNRLLVVVHVLNDEQALRNASIAFDNGADGIFLINHKVQPVVLKQTYDYVREAYPKKWIGLNFLGPNLEYLTRNLSSYVPRDAQALWCDSLGYDQDAPREFRTYGARRLYFELSRIADEAELFGGFDFKYQKPVKNLSLGVREIAPFTDVITTSGYETGSPPTLEKMVEMRQAAGPEKRIAIASGMTPENVDKFLRVVDDFLVSTGISKPFIDELDPVRVREMSDKMHR